MRALHLDFGYGVLDWIQCFSDVHFQGRGMPQLGKLDAQLMESGLCCYCSVVSRKHF